MTPEAKTAATSGNRPRGRRTKDMPDGRQALLAAATQAFSQQGYDAADLRGIAAAAGVSPNLVRVLFGSKADLWEACLDVIVSEAQPLMDVVTRLAQDTGRPLHDRLSDIICGLATFYEAHPGVRGFATAHGQEAPERAELVIQRLLRPAYECAHALIVAGIEAGVVRSSHPALFFALVNAAVSQPPSFSALLSRLAPEIDPGAARIRMIETVVASLLHPPLDTSFTSQA
jgi:AcrR family transcriptional regulator